MLRLGLTGGIASGKSWVASLLRELDFHVLDADLLGHHLIEPGQAAHEDVGREFGREILRADGSVDRKKLGAIVFADPTRRKRLEEITHPAIGARQQRMLSVLDEEAFEGVVLWDAALLFESGGVAKMDRVVVVFADPETEGRRLMERDGLREAEARARIASQMPIAEKAKLADHVIDNSGTHEETERQLRAVHGALLAELAARRRA